MKDNFKFSKGSFEELDDMDATSRSGRRPISSIFQEIGTHLTEILRSEVRLAGEEIRQDVTQVAKASTFLVISAVLALYALGFILLAAVYALGDTVPSWASALIVGGGIGILAAIFLLIGRKRMKLTSLKPDKTIRSLQENVTWLKQRTK